jgi:hypothetical protein
VIYDHGMAPAQLAAAEEALAEVLDAMGSDVCIWSASIAIDGIAADLGRDEAERERLRAALRSRLGLAA